MHKIYRNVEKQITVALKDKVTKDPVDLTDATIEVCYGSNEFTVGSGLTFVGDPMLGKVRVTIPAAMSATGTKGRTNLEGSVLRSGEDPIEITIPVEVVDLPC